MVLAAGEGLDICYAESEGAAHYGYEGIMIDVGCAHLNRALSFTTVVDYEVILELSHYVNPQRRDEFDNGCCVRFVTEYIRCSISWTSRTRTHRDTFC